MDKKAITERLVKVKYLFLKGRASLDEYGPCSAGIAVSLLQDSVEMFLRLIIENKHISISRDILFNTLIDKINENLGENNSLTHRTALNRLNQSRVNFKHFGNEPTKRDVNNFYRDIELFIIETSRNYLDIDFTEVSLIELIGHQRTMNWLKKAEEHLAKEEYLESVTDSAKAFAVFKKYLCGDGSSRNSMIPSSLSNERMLNDFFYKVNSQLQDQSNKIDIIMSGVSLPDYNRFKKYTPSVEFMNNDSFHTSKLQIEIVPQRAEAQFCIRFVLDSSLTMKEKTDYPVGLGFMLNGDQQVKVIKDCEMLIAPGSDQEVIKKIAGKEQLVFDSIGRRCRDGYTHIFFQMDHAYVPETAVDITSTQEVK